MNRKRQFYPNPFSPLTPDSAWALGLWYADGCLAGDGKHAIMMQKEVVLLEQMKAIIAPPDDPERVRIRHCGGRRDAWKLTVTSRDFMEHLMSMGLTARKSTTITWPAFIHGPLLAHFVRGVWDGDGYVSKNKARLRLVCAAGSERFLEGLAEVLLPVIGTRRRVDRRTARSYALEVVGARAIALAHWMYDASTSHNRLARKYDQWCAYQSYPFARRGKRSRPDTADLARAGCTRREAQAL
jgi:hypothetical protein